VNGRNHLEVDEARLDQGEACEKLLRLGQVLALQEHRDAGPVLAEVDIADDALLVRLPGVAYLIEQVSWYFSGVEPRTKTLVTRQ
jgi:hypothetical protein